MAIGNTATKSNHLPSKIICVFRILNLFSNPRYTFDKTEAVSLAAIKRQIYTAPPQNGRVTIIVSFPLSFN